MFIDIYSIGCIKTTVFHILCRGDKKIIEKELEGFGIRLNQKPPQITFRKKEKGGINLSSTEKLTNLDHDLVKSILSEYKIQYYFNNVVMLIFH
jgi:ribosome-interacting GTPase 1